MTEKPWYVYRNQNGTWVHRGQAQDRAAAERLARVDGASYALALPEFRIVNFDTGHMLASAVPEPRLEFIELS